MKKQIVHIINGPNLNLLGKREPEVYGNKDFETYLNELKEKFSTIDIKFFQSNVEGEIINKLQEIGFQKTGIILNAGGYTHTSVAIADAIAAIDAEVIEVHISQPAAREKERHFSLIAKACVGSISGFGLRSYDLAMEYFLK